jgi:tripartite-type tricarboxylate transporter receptor subunit TctC
MFFARVLAAFFVACFVLTSPASAQTYPSRPITLLVPYPPGGATDAIARIMQESMTQSLGQQVVIENIGGAGGMIAASRAARAAPDGYTVLLHQVAIAAGVTLYSNLALDVERDLVPVGLVNTAASILVGAPALPPNGIGELAKWMNGDGHHTRIAHAGVGSFSHLAGVLLAQEIGGAVTHVPYRGAGPALNDVLAGTADLSALSAVAAAPFIKAGKLKAYAVIGRSRFAGLPDLPTMREAGYNRLDIDFWHMLLAPSGTRQPVINRLNGALRHALADASVRKKFEDGGMDLFPHDQQTPEAASALLKREIKLWADVIQANKISAQQ